MTEQAGSAERARSFGGAADDYDRFRPGYPADAVRWALGDRPGRVVDLGAGTGLLTRAVLALGHDVIPVEPDAKMRARLTASTPGVTALEGTAEAIPLPDGSANAAVAGQAYHWFDKEAAHREIARVLRPGGVFAAIWNSRDERVPWVRALTAIADDARGHRGLDDGDPRPGSYGERFGPVERAEYAMATPLRLDGLVRLIRTRSYYRTADAAHRARLEADVRALADRFPELAAEFTLPYRTVVYRARRV